MPFFSNDLERTYKGVNFQAQYRLLDNLTLGGNYTLSYTEGNFNGEDASSGPVSDTASNYYPEYSQMSWRAPIGYVSTDQRHKMRLWGNWEAFKSKVGRLNVGVLQLLNSGSPTSSDGSVDIIRSYSDRLHYWRSAPDGRQGAAILAGWRRGDGELVGWINSDDVLLPGALARVGRAYSREYDVYYGDDLSIDEHDNVIRYRVNAWAQRLAFRYGRHFTGQPGTALIAMLLDQLVRSFDIIFTTAVMVIWGISPMSSVTFQVFESILLTHWFGTG